MRAALLSRQMSIATRSPSDSWNSPSSPNQSSTSCRSRCQSCSFSTRGSTGVCAKTPCLIALRATRSFPCGVLGPRFLLFCSTATSSSSLNLFCKKRVCGRSFAALRSRGPPPPAPALFRRDVLLLLSPPTLTEAESDLQEGNVTARTRTTNRRHCTAKPRRCTLAPACLHSAPPREVAIEASTAPDQPGDRSLLGKAMQRLGALPAGVLAGALFGALVGGVLGRILMRIIFLIDKSNDGAETDFGTVGEVTVGGTLTLLVLSSITGVMGGIFYIGIRRWLPWPSPVARGVFFGLLMMFGPGLIFLGDVDLQIFEPALLIFAAFVAFIVLYGVCVALLTEPCTLR